MNEGIDMSFKLGVLGSGNGSNFQAIADAIKAGKLPGVEIAVVISDVENAFILARAKKEDIPAVYIAPGKFKTKLEPEIEKQYCEVLKKYRVDLVVLAGYMRMVKKELMDGFMHRIINIHPALLPAFPGLHSFKQAFDYGSKITGCTVHFIDEGMDTGPIIGQHAVPILEDDTPERVHERIQKQEHILYPACIKLIAEGRVSIEERHVRIQSPDKNVNNLL